MADLPIRIEAPALRTRASWRVVGALAAALVHVLPVALLARCDARTRDEPAVLPPLQVALNDRPSREQAPARFDIVPATPDFTLALPELRMQAEAEPVALAAPDPDQAPTPMGGIPSVAAPRVASARDCWPYRWLLRMSRTIDSALRYPTDARRRGQRGTAFVRVSVERTGHVLLAPVVRSSGHALLDAEARAVIQRIGRFEPLAAGDCVGYDVIVVDQPVRFGR